MEKKQLEEQRPIVYYTQLMANYFAYLAVGPKQKEFTRRGMLKGCFLAASRLKKEGVGVEMIFRGLFPDELRSEEFSERWWYWTGWGFFEEVKRGVFIIPDRHRDFFAREHPGLANRTLDAPTQEALQRAIREEAGFD